MTETSGDAAPARWRADAQRVLAAIADTHAQVMGWPTVAAVAVFEPTGHGSGEPVYVYATADFLSLHAPTVVFPVPVVPLQRVCWNQESDDADGALTMDFIGKWAGFERPAEVLVDYAHTLALGHARLRYLVSTLPPGPPSINAATMPTHFRYLNTGRAAPQHHHLWDPRSPSLDVTTIAALEWLEQVAFASGLSDDGDLHEHRARVWAARWEYLGRRHRNYGTFCMQWLYAEAADAVRRDDLHAFCVLTHMYYDITRPRRQSATADTTSVSVAAHTDHRHGQ